MTKTDKGRGTPNPNVLIEYGWALKSRGHERIVPVMNEAFGAATETSIPFNIRHIRWPIRYSLADGDDSRAEARQRLVDDLVVAIREILRIVTAPSEPEFEAAACTYDRAVFSQPGEAFAIQPRGLSFSGREQEFVLPEQGPKMFLRLLPMIPTEPLSKQQALAYLRQARLEPFALRSITGGELDGRNKYGAIVYRPTRDGPVIEDLTQLFKDHELWRLTCTLLSYQSERHLPHTFEHGFIQALGRYTSSPKRHCGWRFQFG